MIKSCKINQNTEIISMMMTSTRYPNISPQNPTHSPTNNTPHLNRGRLPAKYLPSGNSLSLRRSKWN
jgi:hypothetical protein